MTTVLAFLTSIIGVYDTTLPIADWAWIMSAAFLLLITWGCIVIVRSLIYRHV